MKFTQVKNLKTSLNKLKKKCFRNPTSSAWDECFQWCFHNFVDEEKTNSPKDVPKGHVVIYLGEGEYEYDHKRFVVKLSVLEHPLFQALLDQAHEINMYGNSKLVISCNEDLFLSVVRCARSSQHRRPFICL